MSTHETKVVRLGEIHKHPNADKLGITQVFGYQVVVALADWKQGDLAVFVEPDYVVPDTEEFAFLSGKRRIGAKRLRGVWSEGLLIKAPADANEGDNVMDRLGIVRWEPPAAGEPSVSKTHGFPQGCIESVPDHIAAIPVYDIENMKKFPFFESGDQVIVTEKLHGTNARFCFRNGQMFFGSRSQWRKPEDGGVYVNVVKQHQEIEKFCKMFPGAVLFGEIYGDVQDMKYGAAKGELRFAAFDVMIAGQFVDNDLFCAMCSGAGVKMVPVVYYGHFETTLVEDLAELDSVYGGIREGVVVRRVIEKRNVKCREIVKVVSRRYLSR